MAVLPWATRQVVTRMGGRGGGPAESSCVPEKRAGSPDVPRVRTCCSVICAHHSKGGRAATGEERWNRCLRSHRAGNHHENAHGGFPDAQLPTEMPLSAWCVHGQHHSSACREHATRGLHSLSACPSASLCVGDGSPVFSRQQPHIALFLGTPTCSLRRS